MPGTPFRNTVAIIALAAAGATTLHAMPKLLTLLTGVGTVAMLWVGGGIILHGSHELGLGAPSDAAHAVQHAIEHATGPLGGVLGWLSYAVLSALVGLVLGAVVAFIIHTIQSVRGKPAH